jgi:acyl carrier protein
MAALHNDIYNRIRPLLAEVLGAEEDEISWDTNVYDDLNADHLEFHDEVIPMLEETFSISIDDEDVPELTTIRELVDYIAENI